MKKLGIYVHIPFCISKCEYCGFYSHSGSTVDEQRNYVEGLIEDISEYGQEYGERYTVDTVFIGGGTPSIMEPELIIDILDALNRNFTLEKDAEITIESNPKTLTKEKLTIYRKTGINRLSIGLQSFDNGVLETLGRAHNVDDFIESYNLARACGFSNINIDLMFGVPGHTMEIWKDTIDKAIELEPEHISFYSLQIEENTPFYEFYRKGEIDLVDEKLDRSMYHFAIKRFKEAGYKHYEISNAAKAGYKCKHNLKYWEFGDYLGIGDNASSFMEGVRFKESPEPEFYENDIGDNISEYTFTGLRKIEGIDLKRFEEKFKVSFWEYFSQQKTALELYLKEGLLVEKNGRLMLSEEGIDISNDIMAEFV